MKSAAKVGFLLVVFVVLLVSAFALLGRSLFAPPTDTYYTEVSDAGGTPAGTPVLLSGVPVGNVTKIELLGAHAAKMTLALKKDTPVPVGSILKVPTPLLGVGANPVEIVPPERSVQNLPPGSTLRGLRAGPLDSILPGGGKETVAEMNKTLVAVRKLLEDQGLRNDVRTLLKTTNKTLETSQETMKSFTALADRGNALLARNERTIDAMIASTRSTLLQVQSTATELAKFAKSGKIQKGATDLLAKANDIASKANDLLAGFDKTVNDPVFRADLHRLARNVADTSERGPGIADSAQKIATNMADITESSKELPGKIGTVMDKATELEGKLSDLVDKVGNVFGSGGSRPRIPPFQTEMDLFRQTHPGYWRTDVTANIGLPDGSLYLGLYDLFESNKVTVELGRDLGRGFGYRYGIYASKPATGVDYRFNSRLALRGDLWNINDPRFDARLRYDFGNGFIGWLGMDRIFRNNAPTIGVGIRR